MEKDRSASKEEGSCESPTSSRFSGTERPLGTDVAVEISQQAHLPRADEDFKIAPSWQDRDVRRGSNDRSGSIDDRNGANSSFGIEEPKDLEDATHNRVISAADSEPRAVIPTPNKLSCLERLLRFVSKVASSGVDHGTGYEVLLPAQADGFELRRAGDPQLRQELQNLAPGLIRGPLRGRIIDAGVGTQAIHSLELPSEMGTYSTEVDEDGAVISVIVEQESDDATSCEVVIPGLERDARIEFVHGPGAEQICAELAARATEDCNADAFITPAKLQKTSHANTLKASFMFEPAIPLGPIVTKVTRKGEIMMLGDYYMWEVLEMLIRFTVMFTVYAFLVVAFLSLVYDEEIAPQWVLFLTLAAKQRENLSFYVAFFFQFLCIYICIFSLRRAQRLGRAEALQHLLPVSAFHICVGQGPDKEAKELAQALSDALGRTSLNVWSEELFLRNAIDRMPQMYRAATQACFQIVVVTPSMLSSPSACIYLQVALQKAPRRAVLLVDEEADWAGEAGEEFDLGRGAERAERLAEVLRGLGQCVVRGRRQLMQHVDAVMLHAEAGSGEEELLSRWWSGAAPQSVLRAANPEKNPSVTLARPDKCVRVLGRRMHFNFGWQGRVRVRLPSGALSTGLEVLEAEEDPETEQEEARGAAAGEEGSVGRLGSSERRGGHAEVKAVRLQFSKRLNVPLLGWFLLLSTSVLGFFVVLGPYLIETYNSYVAFAGTTSGVCRVTGKNKAYEGGGKAAVQVWGCLSVFQACCESCHRRQTCAAFTVSGNDCLIITDWGPDALPDQSPPKPTLALEGARSGMPVPVEELAGVAPPYFSLLQILALFVLVNAPVVLWRFLDVRLAHSPELLPALLAAKELARLQASVRVLVGRRRAGSPEGLLAPLVQLLAACGLPVKGVQALPGVPEPLSLYVLCLDSVQSATAMLRSRAWRSAGEERLLVVVDEKTLGLVPELRNIEAIVVRKEGFVEDLIVMLGQKLGRFLRSVLAEEGVPANTPAQVVSLDEL